MKKIVSLLLMLMMMFGLLALAPAEELVTVVYAVPGDEPKDMAGGVQAINDKLKADGTGVQLEFRYYPWDAWDQKINIMLSTGEKFDAFQVMNDRVSLSNYASRGALADITPFMKEFGQNILAVCPEIMMKSGQVGGKQFAIPAYWVESALDPELTLRKDILTKFGLEVPTSFAQLTAVFEAVMGKWEGVQKPYIPIIGSNSARFGLASMEYEEWPYVIYDKVFFVGQDGVVKNFFETEVFKRDCANAQLWYEKGLISPDVLTTTSDQLNNQLSSGDWFVHPGTIGDITMVQNNYPDITVNDFISITFNPDKPRIRPYGTRNMNAVPLSSEHPEAVVKLFNWVYANQDNYDLFMYGREGVDYEKVDEQKIKYISDPVTGRPGYAFSDWMAGNIKFIRLSVTAPQSSNDMLFTVNEKAVNGVAAMFAFDASAVQTKYTDVQTQIQAVIAPIATGVMPYEENIGNALEMLKAAGVEDLIAEFQRQLDESRK
jgi:putative aldouronate transport system substrate-binding protein